MPSSLRLFRPRRAPLWLACLAFASLASLGCSEETPTPPAPLRVQDEAGLLAAENPGASALWAERLAAFERETGIRVLVRFEPSSPEATLDASPGQYMRGLATALGVDRDGAVAVYFADEADWRLWIGSELVVRFAGKEGTEAELTENDAIHDMKEHLFTEALAAAAAAAPGARLSAQTDRLLEGLLTRLRAR
jgi:hypothetical protein